MSTISARDKIFRRAGHVCFTFNDQIHIWGGLVEHIYKKPRYPNTIPTNCNDLHDTSEVFAYDPLTTRIWRRIVTSGEIPPRTYGCSSCVVQKTLYVFGGHHGYESDPGYVEGNNNLLYELHLTEFRWALIRCLHDRPSPLPPPRSENSMLFHHGGHLYVFGGYGEKEEGDEEEQSSSFHLNPHSPRSDPRGWNNRLTRLNLETRQWTDVRPKGKSPTARAGHSGVVVREGAMLVLFGGRGVRNRLNDTHLLDLDSMTWIQIKTEGGGLPEPRSLHSLTAVGDRRVVLYGGLGQTCQPLNDAWTLDFNGDGSLSWTELPLPYDHGEVRCWHGSACTSDGLLLVHSGLTQEHYLNRIQLDGHAEGMLTLEFGVKSLFRAAFEACLELYERRSQKDVSSFFQSLPSFLLKMLEARAKKVEEQQLYSFDFQDPPSDGEEAFDRSMIHEGV